jgi:hypothetical protein
MGPTSERCDVLIGNGLRNLGQRLFAATLAVALVSCGGSGSPSSTAGTDSTSTSGATGGGTSGGGTSGGGTSGGGTSGGGTSGGGTSGGGTSGTVIFQQPQESGINGHLFVPLAAKAENLPVGEFGLILWQPDPSTSNGQLVPVTWEASSATGFAPSPPLTTTQLGFTSSAGTSTAQMDGDTVGAYLNSQNLPSSPTGQKMMITPQYVFASGTEPTPFANAGSILSSSMDLQVPVAVGTDTYVVADFLFEGPDGVRISVGVKLFGNGDAHPQVGTGYDAPSNSYMIDPPLGTDQQFVTVAPGSATTAGNPWIGWQHFAWSISQTQFVAALTYLAAQYPGKVPSTDPTDYVLAELHLNAELKFQPAPAELGWSMRGWSVSAAN